MRIRTGLAALATATAIAATASPALAASQSAPTPGSNPFNMALFSASSFRWHSNGTGAQVTISNSGADYATINAVNETTISGTNADQYQTGNGHCLYVNGAQQLIVGANSGCDTTRTDERFIVTLVANGGYLLQSDRYRGTYCLTFNNAQGKPVWVEANQTGAWINWTAIQR